MDRRKCFYDIRRMQIQTKEIKMLKFIDTELESKSELESETNL